MDYLLVQLRQKGLEGNPKGDKARKELQRRHCVFETGEYAKKEEDQLDKSRKLIGFSDKATFDEDSLDDEMKCRECLAEDIMLKKKK